MFGLLPESDDNTSLLDEQNSFQRDKSKKPTKDDLMIMDPLSDEFYNYWSKTAKDNTEIYRSVFKCVPDDSSK